MGRDKLARAVDGIVAGTWTGAAPGAGKGRVGSNGGIVGGMGGEPAGSTDRALRSGVACASRSGTQISKRPIAQARLAPTGGFTRRSRT